MVSQRQRQKIQDAIVKEALQDSDTVLSILDEMDEFKVCDKCQERMVEIFKRLIKKLQSTYPSMDKETICHIVSSKMMDLGLGQRYEILAKWINTPEDEQDEEKELHESNLGTTD
jgi:hypothetical protein